MNIGKKTIVVGGAFLAMAAMVLGTTAAFARMHILTGPPPLVRFTGTLMPDADHPGDSNSLFFSVRGQEWLFQVTDVKMVLERRDAFILKDIFPGRLRVSGPSTVMDTFQSPDIEGQTITLEGRLYVDDRRFLITTAEVHTRPARTVSALAVSLFSSCSVRMLSISPKKSRLTSPCEP